MVRRARIALQSTWAVYEQPKRGALLRVLPDFPIAYESVVSAQYLNRNFLPPKTASFIDFFAARCGPAPYRDQGLSGASQALTPGSISFFSHSAFSTRSCSCCSSISWTLKASIFSCSAMISSSALRLTS